MVSRSKSSQTRPRADDPSLLRVATQLTHGWRERRERLLEPFAARSKETEYLDNLDFDDQSLERTLSELARINAWLGGHQTTLTGVRTALERLRLPHHRPIRIVDAGCGSGDGLRALARWFRAQLLDVELIGVDGNPRITRLARRLSKDYPEISYRQLDVFSEHFIALQPRLIVASLFCHHFDTHTIHGWLSRLMSTPALAVVINDLQRHWLAGYAFERLCRLLRLSDVTQHDGAVSVRRGFRYEELQPLLESVAPQRYTLRWCWAFRYQGVVWS